MPPNSRFVILILVTFAFARGISAAEWQVTILPNESPSVSGVEHRRFRAEEAGTGTAATLETAVFSDRAATLRVFDDPNGESSLAEMMHREKCVAGVNGGYFDPDFAPVGLLISDGRLLAPMRKARLLSGVVSVVKGRVLIQRPAEFNLKTKPEAALQCGPFLVERGRAIAGLNATRWARRTFVATAGDRVTLGYCSSVTLAQLAAILAAPEMKIQRALNLDGGSSSAFWFGDADGAFSIREQKSVRDFLGVVVK